MGELSLTQMALELLQINEKFCCYTEKPVSDFELYTFEQVWGSTNCGWGGIGGQAITSQRTYVFVPIYSGTENCLIYFGGMFAYAVPYSQKFIEDVKNRQVESVSRKGKYLKEIE